MTAIASPYSYFTDRDGSPLEGGYLYFGTVNLPPETNPIQVYWDTALTIPAAQPIRTRNGYPYRDGTPSKIFAAADYSITVKNSKQITVFTNLAAETINSTALTQLASTTDNALGDALVGFKQSNASGFIGGAVARTVNQKLADQVTVEDFGAVGDGVTNDNAAFVAMLAATGGTIRMLHKEYKVNQLNITGYAQVTIIGEAMPQPNASLTKLANGTVFIGGLYVEANNVHVENFGLDFGTARTVTATDGIVLNAKPGEAGNIAYVSSVSSMGRGGVELTHGVLVQGYNYGTVQDIFSANHGYGVVVKGRNTVVDTIHVRNIIQSGVFLKGDTGVFAGGVGDGSVVRITCSNVIVDLPSSNIVATGVWIQSPTAAATQVLVSNVHQLYGKTPVFVSSAGSLAGPAFANVVGVNNIMSESAQYGFVIGGITNNIQLNNMTTVNPLTGTAIYMDTNTFNYVFNNINIFVNNVAITSDTCMTLYGTGSFNNITVTNGFRQMKIAVSSPNLSFIKTGIISGDCFIENEGSLAAYAINGAVADAVDPPRVKILPGSAVKLFGKFNLIGSSNKFFANIYPFSGRDGLYACAGIDSTNAVVTIAVRFNDFQLSVEPTLPAGFKSVDLSSILFTR